MLQRLSLGSDGNNAVGYPDTDFSDFGLTPQLTSTRCFEGLLKVLQRRLTIISLPQDGDNIKATGLLQTTLLSQPGERAASNLLLFASYMRALMRPDRPF